MTEEKKPMKLSLGDRNKKNNSDNKTLINEGQSVQVFKRKKHVIKPQGPSPEEVALMKAQEEARIQEQNLSWNEAFTVFPGQYGKQSLLDLSGTGYLLSSLQALPEGCLLRIYNASGDASAKTLQLHLTAAQVREVDLRGEVTDRPGFRTEAGCTRWETSLPRFGFKTFIITTL